MCIPRLLQADLRDRDRDRDGPEVEVPSASYALTDLSADVEARIAEPVKQAAS